MFQVRTLRNVAESVPNRGTSAYLARWWADALGAGEREPSGQQSPVDVESPTRDRAGFVRGEKVNE